ncbi:reverse transcriptase domain-containing protein [Tanacetum coccineum]
MVGYEAKGVTTRGGKSTIKPISNDATTNKHPSPHHDKPNTPDEIFTKTEPKRNHEQTNELQPKPSSIPFPYRLRKEKKEAQQRKFLENLKQLHMNILFTEALAQMPKYAKFLKGLLSNKARLEEACMITMNERCFAVLLNKLPSKEKDPRSFTIPCDIRHLHIDNALADLEASISLMPYTMYEKLGLGEPKPTRMSLELVDRSIQYPRGIAKDVLIKIDKFILPIDFVILDMREDSRILIILGRPFLATARAMIDPNTEDDECYRIDDLDTVIQSAAQELLENENLEDDIIRPDYENHGPDSEISIQRINQINTPFLPNPNRTERSREDNLHLSLRDFCLQKDAVRIMQCSDNFSKMHDDKMLGRCEETNLVLNWEKCHFMVNEGIVLGHKISGKGIEVDKAKIDVIAKLPYPTNLLMKDAKFDFSEDCKKAFNKLKERLTTAPIIISPDWNLPFELMCDASDFAVGAVLGQRIEGKFKPIYYASKTLNDAQAHYTTTEKELLAVVFSFDKFHPYLILSKTIVYTDHYALKYLFSKHDAKP